MSSNCKKDRLGKNYKEISYVYYNRLPSAKDCLRINENDYENDGRKILVEKMVSSKNNYICLVGVTEKKIDNLFIEMQKLSEAIDAIFLKEDEIISITRFKKIFAFKDKKSCEIFLDVYQKENNPLIVESYNRIFESIAGNNMIISLRDFRGMTCRLDFEKNLIAEKGTFRGVDFI